LDYSEWLLDRVKLMNFNQILDLLIELKPVNITITQCSEL